MAVHYQAYVDTIPSPHFENPCALGETVIKSIFKVNYMGRLNVCLLQLFVAFRANSQPLAVFRGACGRLTACCRAGIFAGILLAVPEKGIPQLFHVLVSPLLRTP